MDPRYFVTSTRLVEGVPQTSTFAFCRFSSADLAGAAARDRYGQYGSTVSAVRQEARAEAVSYLVGRLFVRTFRIAFGALVALVAYIFLWDGRPDLGNVPLGQMTLDMLFGALMRGGLLLGAGWMAWNSAFGEGPYAKHKRKVGAA
jgi:hypothetical protein